MRLFFVLFVLIFYLLVFIKRFIPGSIVYFVFFFPKAFDYEYINYQNFGTDKNLDI